MEEDIKQPKQFRNLVLDTMNQLMSDNVVEEFKKGLINRDKWRDFGVELLDFLSFIKTLPNVIPVGIYGYEATGKTVGASFLNPEETYYVNLDKKPLSFSGWRKQYKVGKISEGGNYNDTITSYSTLKDLIKKVHENSKTPLIIYLLAHIEDYKTTENVVRQRLRIAGQVTHKYNIDGSLVHCYQSVIDPTLDWNDPNRYRLQVTNIGGLSIFRSPMGMWDKSHIPNNLQMITDKILEEYQ